jgi:putative ABC transport system substrate-binding protein
MYHLPLLSILYIGVYEMPRTNKWGEDSGLIATEGVDYTWEGEQAGSYAARILKGKFACDIPVVKCSGKDLVLVVNTVAAERMAVTIPQSVLDRADRIVVEEP